MFQEPKEIKIQRRLESSTHVHNLNFVQTVIVQSHFRCSWMELKSRMFIFECDFVSGCCHGSSLSIIQMWWETTYFQNADELFNSPLVTLELVHHLYSDRLLRQVRVTSCYHTMAALRIYFNHQNIISITVQITVNVFHLFFFLVFFVVKLVGIRWTTK